MLLWGPPGTGKTTLAMLVANHADAVFRTLSATSAGVKDIREVLAEARQRLATEERRTVLFLDEIHRFAKNQQDALLPGVEDGTLVLIGATTENPYFEVNSPLMSRMTLFRLESLTPEEVGSLVHTALDDTDRGLGSLGLDITNEAVEELATKVGGDARQALNALEVAARMTAAAGRTTIAAEDVGRGPATSAGPLRQDRGLSLRRRLGVHQVGAWLRSRRRHVLAAADAGGWRGPRVHRPPAGDPRLRGRRPRRLRGVAGGCRRRGCPGLRRSARGHLSPGSRHPVPGHRTEVELGRTRHRCRPGAGAERPDSECPAPSSGQWLPGSRRTGPR